MKNIDDKLNNNHSYPRNYLLWLLLLTPDFTFCSFKLFFKIVSFSLISLTLDASAAFSAMSICFCCASYFLSTLACTIDLDVASFKTFPPRVGVSTRTFGEFSFEDLFITNCLSIDAVKCLDFSSKFKFRLAELKTPLVCLLKVDIEVDAACRRVCETCKLIGGEEILEARAGEGED